MINISELKINGNGKVDCPYTGRKEIVKDCKHCDWFMIKSFSFIYCDYKEPGDFSITKRISAKNNKE